MINEFFGKKDPYVNPDTFGAIKSKPTTYSCPKCGTVPVDDDDDFIDGVSYPIILNEHEGSDMEGSYHDWDEIHICLNCNTKFWFKNGTY